MSVDKRMRGAERVMRAKFPGHADEHGIQKLSVMDWLDALHVRCTCGDEFVISREAVESEP